MFQAIKIVEAYQKKSQVAVIAVDKQALQNIENELIFFHPKIKNKILVFDDLETLPYDQFAPPASLIAEKLRTLYELLQSQNDFILLINLKASISFLSPISHIKKGFLYLKTGMKLNLQRFRDDLIYNGLTLVSEVNSKNEFAIRGSIIDIFPANSKIPYRIDLLDDEIDSIREFSLENQRSTKKKTEIQIFKSLEYDTNDAAIAYFLKRWEETLVNTDCLIYQNLKHHKNYASAYNYLPLFFPKLATIFDYLPPETTFFIIGDIYKKYSVLWDYIGTRYEEFRYDIALPILPPKDLFILITDYFRYLKNYQKVELSPDDDFHEYQKFSFLETGKNILQANFPRILFTAVTNGRSELLKEKLWEKFHINLKQYATFPDFVNDSSNRFGLIVANIAKPFFFPKEYVVIPENFLYNQEIKRQGSEEKSGKVLDTNIFLRDLDDLKVGDLVVHQEHGLGKYLGVESISFNQQKADYLKISYAKETNLYIPVTNLNLITKYVGNPDIKLNELGNQAFQKAKEKAFKEIRDAASNLLEIYAKRQIGEGFAFQFDKEAYQEFSFKFPFELTPDQEKTMQEIINDMTAKHPMDRLICGDVGFGKTEIAMRAAFIAVHNHKQVVVLSPTTVLANQHFETFKDRFSSYPVKIALLSRDSEKKDVSSELTDIASGLVDIVIGTHRLLQKKVTYKDIGLLIVDEEHKFGVSQKETIKKLKANVDVLTLSATPIPRTLNFSFSKLRDLSIIATPPKKRLPVKTLVLSYNKNTIREAILRELLRNGLTYFLHNEVETIESTCAQIKELVPEARVAFAHGQMKSQEIKRIMYDFYHAKFDVLVSTTIIESGIDIPLANTIIINNAQNFGLAQLHQLRGRVGRSTKQAYAYLLIPNSFAITDDAKKRMEAISNLTDLGSGFMIAMQDLEIRGAGEILGNKQSGQISAIGFNLYMEFLDKTISWLKSGKNPTFNDIANQNTEVELTIPAIIPDQYISDVHTRFYFYKKIAASRNNDDLSDIKVELIDRFGLLPSELKNLFDITSLKILAQNVGIKKIKNRLLKGQLILDLYFTPNPKISYEKLVSFVQEAPFLYKLKPDQLEVNIVPLPKDQESFIARIMTLINNII